MGIGSVSRVDPSHLGECWYVDTGMYEVERYGAAYLMDGAQPAVIETGIGTHYDRVLGLLDAAGVDREEVAYICPTHVHLDHAGGAGFLAEACPNATVAVHERGAPHLVDPERLVAGTKVAVGDQWTYYTEPRPVEEERIRPLADGDVIDLGERTLRAIEAPGHAPHQHVFHVPEADAVFTADAAGIYVQANDALAPTTPPPEFDLEQALADVDRIADLEPAVLLYTHFGPVTDPQNVLETYRTVLREWVETVEAVRAQAADDAAAIDTLVDRHAPVDVWGTDKATAETAMNVRGVFAYLDR